MKKQFTILLVTMGIMSAVFAGCGKEETGTQPPAVPESGVETQVGGETGNQADTQEPEISAGDTKTVSGTLEEKKDMLFIITTDDGEAYSIGFETAPEGYDQLKAGDSVVMEYTGELLVVDAFTGEVISLKPAK